MLLRIATVLAWALQAYLLLGVVFAVTFVLRGVDRIDPLAGQSTWGFRLMILPGATALWPLLLLRWARGSAPPEERNAHRLAARAAAGPAAADPGRPR